MKRMLAILLVLSVAALPLTTPVPASADAGQKAVNTGSNFLLGWVDCPKAYADEVNQQEWWRVALGLFITGPIMCGVNVGARYATSPVDLLTIPFGDNLLTPGSVIEGDTPPIRLPK